MSIQELIKNSRGVTLLGALFYVFCLIAIVTICVNLFNNFNQLKYAENIRNAFELQKEQFHNELAHYTTTALTVQLFKAEKMVDANTESQNLPTGSGGFYNKMVITAKDTGASYYSDICPYTDLVTVTESNSGVIIQKQRMELDTITNTCAHKYADATDIPYSEFSLINKLQVFPINEVCFNDSVNSTSIVCNPVFNLFDILLSNEGKLFGKVNVNKSKRGVYFGQDTEILIQ